MPLGSVGKAKDPYIFPFVSVLSTQTTPSHRHSLKPIFIILANSGTLFLWVEMLTQKQANYKRFNNSVFAKS